MPSDFVTTLRGLLEKVKHGDPAERFVADANLIRTLRNHAEAILAVVDGMKRIQQWDCLNPPDPTLCADHPWLKRLVDERLAALDKEA